MKSIRELVRERIFAILSIQTSAQGNVGSTNRDAEIYFFTITFKVVFLQLQCYYTILYILDRSLTFLISQI